MSDPNQDDCMRRIDAVIKNAISEGFIDPDALGKIEISGIHVVSKGNKMAEKPILFSDEMVRAILGGRKTQTRRVIRPSWSRCLDFDEDENDREIARRDCPYGIPGDLLWVRETWCLGSGYTKSPYIYRASFYGDPGKWDCGPWRPSIHMPRRACRLWLRVVNVRVERLQDISEEDAQAEGVCCSQGHPHGSKNRHIGAFRKLWNKLNAKRGFGWDVNPWVCVIEFEREECQT